MESVAANAAIVPAGSNGGISVYSTDNTDLAIEISSYFAGHEGACSLSSAPAYATDPT